MSEEEEEEAAEVAWEEEEESEVRVPTINLSASLSSLSFNLVPRRG